VPCAFCLTPGSMTKNHNGARALVVLVVVAVITSCNEPDLYYKPALPDSSSSNYTEGAGATGTAGGRGPVTRPTSVDAPVAPSADGADARPTPLPAGSPCASAEICAEGFCVDGVCCESACEGSCQRCDLPGAAGTCSPVPAGDKGPAGRPACEAQGSETCGRSGVCDGKGACQLHPEGTACGKAKCDPTAGAVASEPKCDGKGACVEGSRRTCAPYRCDAAGIACATSCAAAADCVGAPCVNGLCGKVDNGAKCASADVCKSGLCVDGVCCESACADQCTSCNLAGQEGKCTPVRSGQPVGGRKACAGRGTCGGSCTGQVTCSYPPTTVRCGAAKCSDARETPETFCDGKGECRSATARSCGTGFSCAGDRCATSCEAPDRRCQDGFYCQGDRCQRKKDTGDGNCSSGLQCRSGHCLEDQIGMNRCCERACAASGLACDKAGKCRKRVGEICNQTSECPSGSNCVLPFDTGGSSVCAEGSCGMAGPQSPPAPSARCCVHQKEIPSCSNGAVCEERGEYQACHPPLGST
jgi:hypothetical protein